MHKALSDSLSQALAEQGYPLTAQYYQGITGLAKRLANRYQQSENEQDFVQVALVASCTAEKKFDVARGVGYYSFAVAPVKAAIQAAFGNSNSGTETYKKIAKFIQEFLLKESAYPTMDDIVIGTQLSRFKVMEIYFDQSRDTPLEFAGEILAEVPSDLSDHFGLLSEEELKVITKVFYEDLSLREVSNQLGLGMPEVVQLMKQSLEKLKSAIGGKL